MESECGVSILLWVILPALVGVSLIVLLLVGFWLDWRDLEKLLKDTEKDETGPKIQCKCRTCVHRLANDRCNLEWFNIDEGGKCIWRRDE